MKTWNNQISRNLSINLFGNTGLWLVVRDKQLSAYSAVSPGNEIATLIIIPNLTVSLKGFQKVFLFWVAGTILEGWESE